MIQTTKKVILKHWNNQIIAPTEPLKLLFKTIREGGHVVETTFDFTDERGRKTKHTFRTLIQPDMDIVDFIPNIPKYFRNPSWMELCEQHYEIHVSHIQEFERKILGQEILASKVIDGTLVAVNTYPFYNAITGFSWEEAIFSTGGLAISLVFRKYGKKYIIRLLEKNAVRIFKFGNKVYGFFNKKKKLTRL